MGPYTTSNYNPHMVPWYMDHRPVYIESRRLTKAPLQIPTMTVLVAPPQLARVRSKANAFRKATACPPSILRATTTNITKSYRQHSQDRHRIPYMGIGLGPLPTRLFQLFRIHVLRLEFARNTISQSSCRVSSSARDWSDWQQLMFTNLDRH